MKTEKMWLSLIWFLPDTTAKKMTLADTFWVHGFNKPLFFQIFMFINFPLPSTYITDFEHQHKTLQLGMSDSIILVLALGLTWIIIKAANILSKLLDQLEIW